MRIIKNLGLPEIDAAARCRSKMLGGYREAGQKLVCPWRRLHDHGECKQLCDDYGTSGVMASGRDDLGDGAYRMTVGE
ncbi:hypothetical protein [Pseudoramibacter faecis]|uniref:hypothetical protein n=1 Tax=Pseudoramibacter faecis TaxID=3108534 RepID=UPI003CC9A408